MADSTSTDTEFCPEPTKKQGDGITNESMGSKIPVPRSIPRKGILKRSSSFGHRPQGFDEQRDKLSPLRSDAPRKFSTPVHALMTTSDISSSRIPKLVTWNENNSFDETTMGPAILREGSSEEDDDLLSMGSSVGSSIAGTWWFGKDKRFIPHCERRKMKDDQTTIYITPTQRKNREIIEVKKKLKETTQQLLDKEQHLSQLRERLTELEAMMEASGSLTETLRLRNRVKQLEELLESETKQLTYKYEKEVRQLQKDAIANMERVRKASVSEMERRKPVLVDNSCCAKPEIRHHATMTLVTGKIMDEGTIVELHNELQAYKLEYTKQQQTIIEMKTKIKELDLELTGSANTLCQRADCVQYRTDVVQRIEAFTNECNVWRTHAAEIELAYKNQQMQMVAMQQAISIEKQYAKQNEPAKQSQMMSMSTEPVMVDSGIDAALAVDVESLIESLNQKQKENDKLMAERDNLTAQMEALSENLDEAQDKIDEQQKGVGEMKEYVEDMKKEVTDRVARHEAAQISVTRLSAENQKLRALLEDLRGETDLQRKTMLDAGIISGRRRSSLLPGSLLCLNVESQTQLTCDEIVNHEKEFTDLSERIAELEIKLANEKGGWSDRLQEVQQSLNLKAKLVTTLTNRIQSMTEEFEKGREGMTKERNEYSQKLEDITKVATRVPLLETELERIREEIEMEERKHNEETVNWKQAVEDTMTAGMKNQRDLDDYYQGKLAAKQKQLDSANSQLEKLQKMLEDTKMRLNLEKVELEYRLQESYKEVVELHDKVYFHKEDKEIMASPEIEDKGTEILKGEIFDENQENLKMVQGELITTRRQVEVLQQKLQNKVQETSSVKESLDTISSSKANVEDDLRGLKSELDVLQNEHQLTRENYDKMKRMAEEEKAQMVHQEKERIRRLESEFEDVRQELDDVIERYEGEKESMKERVASLENEVKEKEKLKAELKEMKRNAETDLHEIDVQILGQKLQQLCAISEEEFSEVRSAPSTPRPIEKRKTNAAVQFLLNRLQEERIRHRKQAESLKEEIRDLSDEVDVLQHLPKRVPSFARTTSEPSLAPSEELQGNGSNIDSRTVANLRAKNLCLMKENGELTSQLSEMRENLDSILRRHTELEVPVVTIEPAAEPVVKVEQRKLSDWEPTPTSDLASDLNELRIDLEGIVTQIDNTTAKKSLNPASVREGRIMHWLEKELHEEKKELDVLTKWYENDKKRMTDELNMTKDERDSLQVQMDKMSLDYHDICRELELYKTEDTHKLVKISEGSKKLCRSGSTTDLVMEKSQNANWKYKYGTLFREFLKVERDFVNVNKERKEYKQECDMVSGEIEVLRLELELEKGTATNVVSNFKPSEGEANLHNDDQYVEMLNYEIAKANMREEQLLKEKNNLSDTVRHLESENKRLKISVQEANFENEQIQTDAETSRQIANALETQLSLVGKKLTDKLPDDASKKMIQQLTDRLEAQEKSIKEERGSMLKERDRERSEHANNIQRFEQQLLQSKKSKTQTAPFLSVPKLFTSRSEEDTTIDTVSEMKFDDAWTWDDVASSKRDTSFHTPPSTVASSLNLCVNCHRAKRRKFRSEPSLNKSTSAKSLLNEEKMISAEKEVEMLTRELDITREGHYKELNLIRKDNYELHKRLHQVTLVAEKIRDPAELEQSLIKIRQLQEHLNEMRAEKEKNEKEQQEMYLVMFKKGQETARAEIREAQGRSADTHSMDSDISYPFPCSAAGSERRPGYLSEDQVVLRFLRDAVYYFLLNKDTKDHLQAIMSLLKFTELQKHQIVKARGGGH